MKRTALWLGTASVLALVFTMYLQPQAMFALATQVWNCF